MGNCQLKGMCFCDFGYYGQNTLQTGFIDFSARSIFTRVFPWTPAKTQVSHLLNVASLLD